MYKHKLIVLGYNNVVSKFLTSNPLIDYSSSKTKEAVGLDIYSTDWYPFNETTSIKFVISDLNPDLKFDNIRNSLMFGANCGIIVYDPFFNNVVQQLEKWIIELVIACGNIPIVLLGITSEGNIEKRLKTISSKIANKINPWELSIQSVIYDDSISTTKLIFDYLCNELLSQRKRQFSKQLSSGAIQKLEKLLSNEQDLALINQTLLNLNKATQPSAKELIHYLGMEFFRDFIHNKKHLSDIPKLLRVLNSINSSFVLKLLDLLAFENINTKIAQENELTEVLLLLDEFKIINRQLWKEFLDQITIELAVNIIAKIWNIVTIVSSGHHFTIVNLLRSIDTPDLQSAEILRLVSEVEQIKEREKTLFEIGSFLAVFYDHSIEKALNIIEAVPKKICQLAKQSLLKPSEAHLTKDETIKTSLEVGNFSKKEVAKKEITKGLEELSLIVSCYRHLPHQQRLTFISNFSQDKLIAIIRAEKNLRKIVEFLKIIRDYDSGLLLLLINRLIDPLYVKLENEPSIKIIQQVMLFVAEVDRKIINQLIGKFELDSLITKMILYYAELDLEKLDIPLLIGIAANYGKERQKQTLGIFQHLFPEAPEDKLSQILEFLFELMVIVKQASYDGDEKATNQLVKIFDVFIQVMLEEINELIDFLCNYSTITRSAIKEVFLEHLLIGNPETFSYEKNRLLEFVQQL